MRYAPTNYDRVRLMYERFGMLTRADAFQPPRALTSEEMMFRINALSEELRELSGAHLSGDLPGVADALVDLVVFALGTAAMMRLPWDELFNEVQRANNAKVVGPSTKERGPGHVDLIKPEGWTPPDIAGTLRRHGWRDP